MSKPHLLLHKGTCGKRCRCVHFHAAFLANAVRRARKPSYRTTRGLVHNNRTKYLQRSYAVMTAWRKYNRWSELFAGSTGRALSVDARDVYNPYFTALNSDVSFRWKKLWQGQIRACLCPWQDIITIGKSVSSMLLRSASFRAWLLSWRCCKARTAPPCVKSRQPSTAKISWLLLRSTTSTSISRSQ